MEEESTRNVSIKKTKREEKGGGRSNVWDRGQDVGAGHADYFHVATPYSSDVTD
jgi:hypothetical protein